MDTSYPQMENSRAADRSPEKNGTRDLGSFCLSCASQGHTCCQGHDIYVTRGDCSRIEHFTGTSRFFEYRGCSIADYADQDDDPIWRQYVFCKDGSRRVLEQSADCNCLFLGAAGCALPLNTRPLVCRLYPHLYSAAGIAGRWDDECPATRSQAAPLIEQGIAGVQFQQAAQWHRMLYTEIQWEANTK